MKKKSAFQLFPSASRNNGLTDEDLPCELPPPPSKLQQRTRRTMPFARRFISLDGEKTLYVEQRPIPQEEEVEEEETPSQVVAPPPPTTTTTTTTTCSQVDTTRTKNPLSAILECGADLSQLTLEPASLGLTSSTSNNNDTWRNYSHAIVKTALLLLDDKDEESLVMMQPQEQQQQETAPPPPPPIKSFDDSTVDYDLYGRLNKSDADLFENGESPGAIRLTEDGLKRHDRKTMKKNSNNNVLPNNIPKGLAAMRLEKAQRQYQQQQQRRRRRQDNKEEEAATVVVDNKTKTKSDNNETNKPGMQKSKSERDLRAHDDEKKKKKKKPRLKKSKSARDLRNADGNNKTLSPLKSKSSRSLLARFKSTSLRNVASTDPTPPVVTTTGSDDDDDQDSVKAFYSLKEQSRIEKLRQKELERQRKREAEVKRVLPSKILHMDERSSALEAGIEVMNEPMDIKKKKKKHKRRSNKENVQNDTACTTTTTTPSDDAPTTTTTTRAQRKLSTSVQHLPCVVCSVRERTHIAVPCMHFSFCEPCSKILKRENWACPVCGTPHTTYNQVFA